MYKHIEKWQRCGTRWKRWRWTQRPQTDMPQPRDECLAPATIQQLVRVVLQQQ